MPNAWQPTERRTSVQSPLRSSSRRREITYPSPRCIAVTSFRPGATSTRLGVVARPVPVDDYHGLLAHHPRVVPAGQRGDIAGPGDHLGAVVHANCELPAHVILEVRRLATVGPRDRFDIV